MSRIHHLKKIRDALHHPQNIIFKIMNEEEFNELTMTNDNDNHLLCCLVI